MISLPRLTLIGPESTGKTTLAIALAEHYHTSWAPEYLREFCQRKWEKTGIVCEWDDLIPILQGSLHNEQEAAIRARGLVILDTNPITLEIYSKLYYRKVPAAIKKASAKRPENEFYILTNTDVPWEFDVLRDRENERDYILDLMKSEFIQRKLPYLLVSGPVEERLKQINRWLKSQLSIHASVP